MESISTRKQTGHKFISAVNSPYTLLTLFLFQCVVFVYLCIGYRTSRALRSPNVYDPTRDLRKGELAPALYVESLEGDEVNLLQQRTRQPLVVIFAASCGSCEEKDLAILRRVKQIARLAVVMPVIPPEAETLFKAHEMSDVLFREIDRYSQMRYNVAWRPRLFVVDEQGKLLYVQPSEETFQQAAKHIEHLLAGHQRG